MNLSQTITMKMSVLLIRPTRLRQGLLLAVLLTAGYLTAATNYVALHTGGTYDGVSWATAFTNLQQAVDAATGDNVVLVKGGTYALTNSLSITQTNLLIRGGYEGAGIGPGNHNPVQWPTTLSRGGVSHRIVLISGGHDTRLECLTITGGNVNEGAGVRVENSLRVVLTDCTVSNNACAIKYVPYTGGGVYATSETSLTLFGCHVRGNQLLQTHDGAGVSQGSGLYSSGTLVLQDTVIANNILGHVKVNKTQGAGLYFAGVALEMRNVLVSGNFTTLNDTAGGIYVSKGSVSLQNCTVADHATAGIVQTGTAVLGITNSVVCGNWDDLVGTATIAYSNIGDHDFGGSNISADPAFELGYYLASSSPCQGTGSATATSLGLAGYAKNRSGDTYGPTEIVNMGFHYTNGFDLQVPDLYVSTTGSDTLNDGTSPSQAFRSLTKALATAHADTRIHVAAGTYTKTTETFPLALNDKTGIEIIGTNAALTRFDASGASKRVMTLSLVHRLRLKGVTLTGGSATANGAGLWIDNSQDVRLTGCIIANNQYTGTAQTIGGGLYGSLSSAISLSNCVVHGNLLNYTHDGSGRVYGAGIWSGGRLSLRDCMITNNMVRKANINNYFPEGSGLYFAGPRLELVNSLIADNHDYEGRSPGGIQIASGTAELVNLTISGNDNLGLRRIGGTVTVNNSILWGNGVDSTGTVSIAYSCVSNSTDYVDGGHNVSGNPLFMGSRDYRLQSGSSCINQGLKQPWMETAFDLAGQPRIMGGRVDLGAYEWRPPAGTLLLVH